MNVEEQPVPKSAEPGRSELRRILEEKPEARGRLGRAVASLGLMTLVTIAALGLLLIWHMKRRARLIRESLGPPKDVILVDPLAARSDEFPLPKPESPHLP